MIQVYNNQEKIASKIVEILKFSNPTIRKTQLKYESLEYTFLAAGYDGAGGGPSQRGHFVRLDYNRS